MTQIPAGWYPDPDPNQAVPGSQRYWDGRQWTEQVAAPAGQPSDHGAGPMPGAGGYGQMPGSYAAVANPRETTPDGQQLAHWWRRVAASVLDGLIVAPVVVLIALPWIRRIASAYSELARQAIDASQNGAAVPDQNAVLAEIAVPILMLTLIGIGVNFVYYVGFLKWRSATPGKLITGLRVRLRETPGPLSWATVLKRWLGQFGYGLLGFVPVLGAIASIYPVVDLLWPLWDGKRQALHDKVARTNVVRVR